MNVPIQALLQFRRALACATHDSGADWDTRLRAAQAFGCVNSFVRAAIAEQQSARDQNEAWLDRQAA